MADRIATLRMKISARKTEAADLNGRLSANWLKTQLASALRTLNDIESVFLTNAENPAAAERLRELSLFGAEAMFTVADSQVRMVEDAVARFGDDVQSIK